jgi:hypothetical protein
VVRGPAHFKTTNFSTFHGGSKNYGGLPIFQNYGGGPEITGDSPVYQLLTKMMNQHC